jgi:hypothetical protein
VKLGFLEKIWDTKDMELQRGSKIGEIKRPIAIKFSFKKFFQSKHEVRVSGKNLGH